MGGSGKWPSQGCQGVFANASVCTADGGNHGLLSQDPTVNPLAGATMVYIGEFGSDGMEEERRNDGAGKVIAMDRRTLRP